jgi:lysophospholipase L1-like esterase
MPKHPREKTYYSFVRIFLSATLLIWSACSTEIISTMEGTAPSTSSLPNTSLPFRSGPASYLALGDSYTIGQGVDPSENYPNVLTENLRKRGIHIKDPVIVAVTGWTTKDLMQGIDHAQLQDQQFDLLTLLIGVNNQYRGQSLEDYGQDFRKLLATSLKFVGGDANRIIVISIPDWGVTPYATSLHRDKQQIATEIDLFNEKNKSLTLQSGIRYLEITNEYRSLGHLQQYLATDGLHPSRKVYARWAELLAEIMINEMNIR